MAKRIVTQISIMAVMLIESRIFTMVKRIDKQISTIKTHWMTTWANLR